MKKTGTYAGLRVLNPSNSLLYSHCTRYGIIVKKSMFDRRLHTTIIYSTKHCPEMIAEKNVVHEAEFNNYDIFTGRNGDKVLVVKLSAPSIVARHIKLMEEHNAVYDFPVFIPHITLTYTYTDTNFLKLPPINFPIMLGDEYVDDLKLNWTTENG